MGAVRKSQAMSHGVRICSHSVAWICMALTRFLLSTSTLMHLVRHGGPRARRRTGNGAPTAQLSKRPQSTTSRHPKSILSASRPLNADVAYFFCAYYAVHWTENVRKALQCKKTGK